MDLRGAKLYIFASLRLERSGREKIKIRMDKMQECRITLSVSTDLSPLPYRPEDFTPDDPLVHEILKTGVKVV